MKQEELILGTICYWARFLDLPNGTERIVVSEYKVTKSGKVAFQVVGAHGAFQGHWSTNAGLIRAFQRTPAGAVDYLLRFTEAELSSERLRLVRLEERTVELRTMIDDWRSKNP